MARTILTGLLIVLLNVLVGCSSIDTGRGRIVPPQIRSGLITTSVASGETDIVEQVAASRQAYRQGLELLVGYYTRRGSNMKLTWVKKELKGLDTMPQYNYIFDVFPESKLRAKTSIPEADTLYYDALQLESKAGLLIFLKNENTLRLALDKYDQLIRKHPSSDKIDDAAYRAGVIYDYFKDYTIALLYYQRAYEWDPGTIHPARFKAAYILDKRLRRRADALKLYQEAVQKESRHEDWIEFAEKRVRELTKSEQGG